MAIPITRKPINAIGVAEAVRKAEWAFREEDWRFLQDCPDLKVLHS
jgi:hypothetical protein